MVAAEVLRQDFQADLDREDRERINGGDDGHDGRNTRDDVCGYVSNEKGQSAPALKLLRSHEHQRHAAHKIDK